MAEPPSGPPPPSASSEQTRLRGHIGHLTRQEEAALKDFKIISAEQGLYRPETSTHRASHDDGTLVRFLRARKFVPQDALAQFKDTEHWRKENNLDALYERIDIRDYQEARSVYPQWTGRRDKRGIPVYLYEVGKLDSKKMIAYSQATSTSKAKGPSPSRMLRLFALYENLTRFVMPLCSAVSGRPNPETPVDQSNNIVDISRVGLKQFWSLRGHMQDASQLATAHYPETLDRIFIIGAPSFFPTVWGWIKKWFDPITTSKIFILSQDQVLPTLSAFMDISSIPKKYGGGLDFECGMRPSIDPEIRKCLDVRDPKLEELFLTGPTRWVDGSEGDMVALSVGSIDGKPHKEAVATMHSWAVRTATGSSNFQRMHSDYFQPMDSNYEAHPSVYQNSSADQSRLQSKGDVTNQAQTQAPPPPQAPPNTETQDLAPSIEQQPPLQPVESAVEIPPHATNTFQTGSSEPQVQPIQEMPRPSVPSAAHQNPIQSAFVPESESVLPNGSIITSQPAYLDGQVDMQNGRAGPPKNIPIPPTQLQRTETLYMTPATEPSELKNFQ
ncbi:MAG: hypothetical protein LQ341_004702 [Variospora aurantia]|nr:MAG: hypothetical protein LQ341_004702 [Variospora aurantia]